MQSRVDHSIIIIHLRLNLQLSEVGPELRLVRLQELLVQQAQTDDALGVRVDRGQSVTVAYVKSPEREIELYRVIE